MSAASAVRADGDDRGALLRRGREQRTVRRETEHLEPIVPELPGSPAPINPAAYTGTDAERLEALEGALDQASTRAQTGIDMMKAWLDMQRGIVLREIRDSELYKVKADTFEQYAQARWQMSRPRAYELITAAPVLMILSGIPDTRPAVSQALALAPAYEQAGERGVRQVVRQVEALTAETGRKPTAKAYKDVVQALGYRPEPVVEDPAAVEERERVRRDAEEHDAAQAMNDDLKHAGDLAEELAGLLRDLKAQHEAGVRPLDLGRALTDKSKIRRHARGLGGWDVQL